MNEDLQEQAVAVLSSREMQLYQVEIDRDVATAHQYPRDVAERVDEVMALATRTPAVAEKCYYQLPGRWDKNKGCKGPEIMGPSIRLMEIFGSQWHNLQSATRIVEIDARTKKVRAEAVVWDIQNNTRLRGEVVRSYFDTNDGLALAAGAAQSVALRNVLRRVIGPFVDEVYEECMRVVAGNGDPVDRVKKAVAHFVSLGVSEREVLGRLGIESANDAQPEHVVALKGFATAIKDGDATIEEIFGRRPKGNKPKTTPADLKREMADEPVNEEASKQMRNLVAQAMKAAQVSTADFIEAHKKSMGEMDMGELKTALAQLEALAAERESAQD